MLSLIQTMKFLLIIIQLALLAAGYGVFFNQWVRPSLFPVVNLLPLAFLIIFVLNLALLVLWWFYNWKLALLFTILSLLLLLPLRQVWQYSAPPAASQSDLKVITYNVRYFFDDADGITTLLRDESADVIFIQEMGPQPEYIIEQAFNGQKHYFENFNSLGIASRYPIIEAQSFRQGPHPTTYAYADISLPNDTVRFINFYLESLHINQTEVKNTGLDSRVKNTGLNVARKVARASRIHEQQINQIRNFIRTSPYPVILAGDMNAVPGSYEYYALKRGFNDSFVSHGAGFGTTFPGFGYPLRLDYIFSPPEFQITSYKSPRVNYSDHFPVIAEFDLPD